MLKVSDRPENLKEVDLRGIKNVEMTGLGDLVVDRDRSLG